MQYGVDIHVARALPVPVCNDLRSQEIAGLEDAMVRPVVRGTLAVTLIALAWGLRKRWVKRANDPSTPGKAPWPTARDLSDDTAIVEGLSLTGWFTVTDLARALQGVPAWRKPSGSAGRDARAVVERWVRERRVESARFGPSRRLFYRLV